MFYDKELVRRGVIVPVFKNKQSNNLTFNYKGKYYLNYLKARSKARSLNLGSAAEWKKYCYLHTQLPQGLPESPEIVYRNNGWKNFSDWLGVKIIKNTKKKRKKRKVIAKVKIFKSKPLNSVKNYNITYL